MRYLHARAVAVFLIAVTALGCELTFGFRGDWWIYVRNDTDSSWFVRVQMLPDQPDRKHVARIDPGADGPAVVWRGSRETPVEVLDPQCNVVGVFHSPAADELVVDGVPGLIGRIEAWKSWGANRAAGITDVDQCGGEYQ